MKIIISPSKTQRPDYTKHFTDQQLLYAHKHKQVLSAIKKLSKNDISSIMKLKGDLLDSTYRNIKDYNRSQSFQAFYSFEGLVFKNMDRLHYDEADKDYIRENLVILDAFYGVLQPGTLIKQYRLDMRMKIGLNLYQHWNIEYFFKDQLIINLASDEFSTMIKQGNKLNIHFKQFKDGKYINQATYSKMARGMMVDYLIKQKIEDVELIKQFKEDQYLFNQELSDDQNFVFTRTS